MESPLKFVWDPGGYFFWLLVVSAGVLVLERIRPWRPRQKIFRRQWSQDIFWLVFNGHFAGILVATGAATLLGWLSPAVEQARSVSVLAEQPFWAQLLGFFLLKDFLEWGIHNLLHRVPWLWEFHKVHHSIEELDWIGNFRFHWMEIVVYQGLTYFPLIILGVHGPVLLVIAVISTLIGHLNHANLNLSWGPLRYVLNSPRMHVWHHAKAPPEGRPHGVNFGICLSLWDWIFGTAYLPRSKDGPAPVPDQLGFEGIESYPRSLPARLLHPLGSLVRFRRK